MTPSYLVLCLMLYLYSAAAVLCQQMPLVSFFIYNAVLLTFYAVRRSIVPKLDYTINYLVTLYKYAPTNSSSSQLNNVAVAYNGNKKKENKKNQIIRMETEYNRKPRLPLEANYETDLYSRDRVQLSNTAPYSIYAYPTNHHMPTSDLSIGSIEITHNDHKPNPNKDNKGADHLNTEYDDPIIMPKLRKHRTILFSEHVDHTSRITSLDNNTIPNKLNKR